MSPTPAPFGITIWTSPWPSPVKGWKYDKRNHAAATAASPPTRAATTRRRTTVGLPTRPELLAATRRTSAIQLRRLGRPRARLASRARRAASRSAGVRPPGTGGRVLLAPPSLRPPPAHDLGGSAGRAGVCSHVLPLSDREAHRA